MIKKKIKYKKATYELARPIKSAGSPDVEILATFGDPYGFDSTAEAIEQAFDLAKFAQKPGAKVLLLTGKEIGLHHDLVVIYRGSGSKKDVIKITREEIGT